MYSVYMYSSLSAFPPNHASAAGEGGRERELSLFILVLTLYTFARRKRVEKRRGRPTGHFSAFHLF